MDDTTALQSDGVPLVVVGVTPYQGGQNPSQAKGHNGRSGERNEETHSLKGGKVRFVSTLRNGGGVGSRSADRSAATSMDTMRTHCSPEKGRKGVLGNEPIT